MRDGQDKIFQLIVRQRPAPGPQLDPLLRVLQQEFGLEAYTARQRLVGAGLAFFGQGNPEKTARLAACLQDHGYPCWMRPPAKPHFAPERVRGLEIASDQIRFDCRHNPVVLARGEAVVAVLADVSGGLIDKHLQRLLAQNTYRGREALQILSRDEMVGTIYRGQPVFDCYLLDGEGEVKAAIRFLAGRFNIDGLGGRAGLSTIQNLQAVVRLVEEYADPFRIHYDFGLGQLPKCRVARLSENPGATLGNLDSLTYYGWLVAGLRGDGLSRADNHIRPVRDEDAGLESAVVVGSAAAGSAAPQGQVVLPGLEEIVREVQAGSGNTSAAEAQNAASGPNGRQRDLPPPPERPRRGWSLQRGLTLGGTALGALLGLLAGLGQFDLLGPLFHYGTLAGIFPALLAGGFFMAGFYFVRLKRRVENTPTSKVRSMTTGMVEVHGRARRMYALVSPMTQSPCIFYRLRKYRRARNDRWKLVRQTDSRHVPFQVDDGTGRVAVDPGGATVRAKTRRTGFPGESALAFTAFRQEYEDEKWVEDLIYEGTSLYVLGFAYPLKEDRQTLRERTMARLRDLKLDRQALRRYDTDGDGQISSQEWDAARRDAEQEALQDHLAEQGVRKRQEEHLVIARPRQRGLPFVIAETISETALSRRFGLISLPLLLAGLATAGFAVFKLLDFLSR